MDHLFHENELTFWFHGAINVEKADEEGKVIPSGMQLVDFILEEETRILLIEVKDPSHSKADQKERKKFLKKEFINNLVNETLVPKARDTYTLLHLMKRDSKPFYYIVVMGFDRFPNEKALLLPMKEKLLQRLRQECGEPWKKQYIQDCLVVSVEEWNKHFENYRVTRN